MLSRSNAIYNILVELNGYFNVYVKVFSIDPGLAFILRLDVTIFGIDPAQESTSG